MSKKSKMMDELYGEDVAGKLFAQLEELDSEFNGLAQQVVYDSFWSRPGLNMSEKSLATLAVLVTMGRGDLAQGHINGLLKCGWSVTRVAGIIDYLAATNTASRSAIDKARGALEEVISSHALAKPALKVPPTNREKHMIEMATRTAQGSSDALEQSFKTFTAEGGSRDDIRALLMHLTVYCGFPATMNGLATLKTLN